MENSRHFCLPEGKRTPTAVARMVSFEITQYVDKSFPEAAESFDETLKDLTECGQPGNLGENIHRALFLSSENPEICRGSPTFFYLPLLCIAYAYDAICLEMEGRINEAWASIAEASYWLGMAKGGGVYDNIGRDIKSNESRRNADALHDKPGGSRELARKICEIWAQGNFESRETCADQEWQAIGFGSRKAARNALIGTPDPSPWTAMRKKPSKC